MVVISGELANRVSARAERVRPGVAVATAFAALLWALGWVAAVLVSLLSMAVRWSVAAVMVGWADGRAVMAERRRGPA